VKSKNDEMAIMKIPASLLTAVFFIDALFAKWTQLD